MAFPEKAELQCLAHTMGYDTCTHHHRGYASLTFCLFNIYFLSVQELAHRLQSLRQVKAAQQPDSGAAAREPTSASAGPGLVGSAEARAAWPAVPLPPLEPLPVQQPVEMLEMVEGEVFEEGNGGRGSSSSSWQERGHQQDEGRAQGGAGSADNLEEEDVTDEKVEHNQGEEEEEEEEEEEGKL